MLQRQYKPGDPVIFRKTKYSTCPGPRAKGIAPARYGEQYSYLVDKFWTVLEVRDDGTLLLVTRRGKRHVVDASSPLLRRAYWWERLVHRHRFPTQPQQPQQPEQMAVTS